MAFGECAVVLAPVAVLGHSLVVTACTILPGACRFHLGMAASVPMDGVYQVYIIDRHRVVLSRSLM